MACQIRDILLFVNVVFRHGNRSPSSSELNYLPNKTDLYNNFSPVGLGELTDEGKENMFKLGSKLWEKYGYFLNDTYSSKDVEARSTDIYRTKLSLALVIAGLYPSLGLQSWNTELNLESIPITYVPSNQDYLLLPITSNAQYLDELLKIKFIPEVVHKAEQSRLLAEKLSILLSKSVASIRDIWTVYNALMGLKSMNYTLPTWYDNVLLKRDIRNAVANQFEFLNYNDEMKKLNGGMLLKRIIDDMKTAMNLDRKTNTRKINLFSGHDVNIVGVLTALGMFELPLPEYSSAVIVELIQRDSDYYVKVIRYFGSPAEFEDQEIPDCGTLCPFEKFIDLVKKIIPSDDEVRSLARSPRVDFSSVLHALEIVKFN